MRSYLVDMIYRMTDAYSRDENSNLGKLFKLVSEELKQLDTATETIKLFRDIDQATGKTLDLIGGNVKQFRGTLSDDIYRLLIKVKILRNLSNGSINTLINIFSFLFGIEKSNINITEKWPDEPAAMLINLPPGTLNGSGLTFEQFCRLADSVAAGGVGVSSLYQGTFQFSSQPTVSEYDELKGFADLDRTVGGYFGAYYDPATGAVLPF